MDTSLITCAVLSVSLALCVHLALLSWREAAAKAARLKAIRAVLASTDCEVSKSGSVISFALASDPLTGKRVEILADDFAKSAPDLYAKATALFEQQCQARRSAESKARAASAHEMLDAGWGQPVTGGFFISETIKELKSHCINYDLYDATTLLQAANELRQKSSNQHLPVLIATIERRCEWLTDRSTASPQ